MKQKPGSFTISLDFELYWGMRDVVTLDAYRENLLGVWEAVPKMLDLFEKYGIHVTWATVGFLWYSDIASLKAAYPEKLPEYDDAGLCPYGYLKGAVPPEPSALLKGIPLGAASERKMPGLKSPVPNAGTKVSGSGGDNAIKLRDYSIRPEVETSVPQSHEMGQFGGSKLSTSEEKKLSLMALSGGDELEHTAAESEAFEKMHFAKALIEQIKSTPYQEIATHTYSHYYTREPHISMKALEADLLKALEVAKEQGIEIDSLVFPRNQIDPESLDVLKIVGIETYRGNPNHWAYREGETDKTFWQRVYRFVDIYLNLSGSHISVPKVDDRGLIEVKSSLFLRPYSQKFALLEGLKLRRVEKAMTQAAQRGENFHLWWHPHNFGIHQIENLANLEVILKHYQELNQEYGMLSLTMQELGEYV